ncbi:hypothetical protein [Actinophytocola sp.]|uniref:hypothetical protein n=1 Tax=Actinophytocola sp. TaxID=1872138 RepID=UPI002ED29DF0
MTINFVSNEVIVQGVTAAQVWRYLVDTSTWESYYDNVADISFPHGGGPALKEDAELATQTPNPMLNGHQAWLDGLVRAASGRIGA